MKDWKIIAFSATLAFLFSFISGLLGRVSFGILFFRALLGALLFGALGFGVSVLLRKFLPEMFELESSVDMNEDISQDQVNESLKVNSKDLPSVKPLLDISIGEEDDESVSDMTPANNASSGKNDNMGNELVDEISESGIDTANADNDQLPENIDALPDMGVFSNSFENVVDSDENGSNNPGAVTLDIMGEEQDSELVAKALRTMVKKDQEG
jgi:hypothetical protein